MVKAMVFPVVRYGCESWTVKKAERPQIDAFELWCWKRLLRGDGDGAGDHQIELQRFVPVPGHGGMTQQCVVVDIGVVAMEAFHLFHLVGFYLYIHRNHILS